METCDISRRALLRSGAGVATLGLLGSLAGCQGPLGGGEGDSRIDDVPAGADGVLYADLASLLGNPNIRDGMNDILSEGSGPASLEELLDTITEDVGLDPRNITEMLMFSTMDGDTPIGTVLWTDWSQSEVFDIIRERSDTATETTYNGVTVLKDEPGRTEEMVGVLEEGVFAYGNVPTVESVIDLRKSDTDPAQGEVREAFQSAGGGPVQFGFDVPTDEIPEESSGPVDASAMRPLMYGYGSLSEEMALVVNFRAESADAASEIAETLDSGLSLAEQRFDSASMRGPQEQFKSAIESTSVEQDGQTIVVRTEEGGMAVVAMVAGILGSFLLGLGAESAGSGRETSAAPSTVAFSLSYEAGELEVRHASGEAVPATELYIRGDGVPTGRWDELGGSTSGEHDGQPAVVAGDALILEEVPETYEVRVVWQSPNGDQSVTLVESDGPGM